MKLKNGQNKSMVIEIRSVISSIGGREGYGDGLEKGMKELSR